MSQCLWACSMGKGLTVEGCRNVPAFPGFDSLYSEIAIEKAS